VAVGEAKEMRIGDRPRRFEDNSPIETVETVFTHTHTYLKPLGYVRTCLDMSGYHAVLDMSGYIRIYPDMSVLTLSEEAVRIF
jgi:hypothetical protein